jgi:nicotinamide riboside transporter PnuC
MSNSLTAKGWVALLGIFAGLCTVFALIVSVAEKWQEPAQESWPELTAIVERCSVDP